MDRQFKGGRYVIEVGSETNPRDGMVLELRDEADALLLEVYFDDPSGALTLTTFDNSIALEDVEYCIEQAKLRLPPKAT